jgi:hypothetical protein
MRGEGVATPVWNVEFLDGIPGIFHLDFLPKPHGSQFGLFFIPMEQNAGFSVTSAAPSRVNIVDLTDIIAN